MSELVRITVGLDPDTNAKLNELDVILGSNKSNVVRICINRLYKRIDELREIMEKDNAPIDLKDL